MQAKTQLTVCALLAATTALSATSALAADDGFGPPAGYYNSALTGITGAALDTALHNIIDNHTIRSYGDARTFLPIIDDDPNNSANHVLIYNDQIVPDTWDSGSTWNREHTWPRSRGVNSSGPDNSDLHMLRGCNPGVNSSRGNEPFGAGSSSYWDPNALGGQDRGEMARNMFYAATRYDGSDSNTTDLILVNGFPFGNAMGDLAQLIQWHYDEEPNSRERRRNDLIGDLYQFNRNPYIDHPEFAWAVYGSFPNDSSINIAGSSVIDLGAINIGDAISVPVTLNKTGSAPTSFMVTTTGAGFSDLDDLARTFSAGAQSRVANVTIDTSVLGGVFATLIVDNTDLTSAGLGLGSDDLDDDVTIMWTVIDPTACPADLTTDGLPNGIPDSIVTLSDFTYYLSLWANADASADITTDGVCNPGNGGDGVTLSDFSCYLSLWSAGCP
ncbi:MAG: endonuclease [Planctomycetota bacterium]